MTPKGAADLSGPTADTQNYDQGIPSMFVGWLYSLPSQLCIAHTCAQGSARSGTCQQVGQSSAVALAPTPGQHLRAGRAGASLSVQARQMGASLPSASLYSADWAGTSLSSAVWAGASLSSAGWAGPSISI